MNASDLLSFDDFLVSETLNFQMAASPLLISKDNFEGAGEKDKRGWMALSGGVS